MTPAKPSFSFLAQDNNGDVHLLDVFDITDGVEKMRRITMRDGMHVNRLEKRKYALAETGEILTSDDPQAP